MRSWCLSFEMLWWYFVPTSQLNYKFLFSCVILNEYPLPMMLFLLEASHWMPFSVARRRFQLGIQSLLAGRKFKWRADQYFEWLCVALLFSPDNICISFAPPDDFKLALLTLELEYTKARTNRNEEVSSLFCLWCKYLVLGQCNLICMSLVSQLDAVVLAQQLRRRFLDQVCHSQLTLFLWVGFIPLILSVNWI